MNRSSSVLFVAGLLLAVLALTTGIAAAHAKLKSATPAPGATVQSAPATLTLVFDNHHPLDSAKSTVTVTDASGARVDAGDAALSKDDADRKTMTVSLKSGLGNGVYTVKWEAASDGGDGSVASGSYSFGVGVAAPLPATGMFDSAPTAWLPGVSLLLIVGGGLFQWRARRVAC